MTAAKFHLSLNVTDVVRSALWYEAFFGQPTHKRRDGYANFDLERPALKLALQQGTTGSGALNHMGILVDSTAEVLATRERLEATGLTTFTEENVECCHARQNKIWVKDPDGNAWEVYTILDDEPSATCCGQAACCS